MRGSWHSAVEHVQFADRRGASLVRCGVPCDAASVVAALGLPTGRPVIVVNGGTDELSPDAAAAIARMFTGGVVPLVTSGAATVVTGATDAGVFALLGQALASASGSYVCVGVAPSGVTTWPGRPHDDAAPGSPRVPLEPHHTHFVIVDGDEWGSETPVMLAVPGVLADNAPSVAVLAGGGQVAATEVAGHLRRRRPVVAIDGSGRLADRLAAIAHGAPVDDELQTIGAHKEKLVVSRVDQGPDAFREMLARRLGMVG